MGLPRTFIGFSSTDINYYRLMLAWKEHEHINFNFTNCQLSQEINSWDEAYIKRKCRERIDMAGTFAVLIGRDTRSKHKYVRWEMEVALEKKCRIIGINLDGSRRVVDSTCPPIIRDVGAVFVPFSPKIVAYALENYRASPNDDYHYNDHVYAGLGYKV
ncbi:TIR domain-containing protein [Pseudomonas sp. FW300-N2A2]|uniref:TIR domain-containing protein n=1 Tax=Pseudomonas sp. FW300-N2A2 TaxID=2751316 RepID=UPI001A90E4B8|nr:TIR domain-containing protein [Pseudomonas sp. FW300-N2A2]